MDYAEQKARVIKGQLQISREMRKLWANSRGPILQIGHPILRERLPNKISHDALVYYREVVAPKLIELTESTGALGLAAHQIGYPVNVIAVRRNNGKILVMIRPLMWDNNEGKQTSTEGCLSIPYLQGEVERAKSIGVEYETVDGKIGKPIAEHFTNREAAIIQHEIDHTKNTYFYEKANKSTLKWIIPK